MKRIIDENINDSKLVIKQRVTYTDVDYDYSDIQITNEEDLETEFQREIDKLVDELNSSEKLKIDFFGDAAEYVSVVKYAELDSGIVTAVVIINRELNREQREFYFKDFISDLISDLEPQRMEFIVNAGVMNAANKYDPSTGREWEEEQDEFEDSDYVNLIIDPDKNNIPTVDSSSISESIKREEMNDSTREFFDEFEYIESEFDSMLQRQSKEYLHNTYGGSDIEKFDKYVKQELENGSASLDDIRSRDPEWIDIKIEEAREVITESYVKEDIKDGIVKILDKFRDKIDYKYQGNKKDKDGSYYDTFYCKIKKAGIFDLIGFEEKLKELGNKFDVIFKIIYPNDNQNHASFWVKGRFKNRVVNNDGTFFAYESKQLKESEYLDKKKEDNGKNKEKYLKQSKKNGFHKQIILDVQDYYGDIEAMINYISDISSAGHSFSIDVDPHDETYKQTFGIDGDGSDRIKILEVKNLDEQDKEEEGE